MEDLQNLLNEKGDTLTLVLGYGDSSDGTGQALYDECHHRFDSRLIDVSHGGRFYGSVVNPLRFKQLAFVVNTLWGHIPETADIVGLVESDLIWKADQLLEILPELNTKLILAPMVFHPNKKFYDTWAFKMNGINFKYDRPYHPSIRPGQRYYDMNSIGSVFFTDAGFARQLSFPEEDVVVGFCRQARELGGTILLDSYTEVYHP